MTDSRFQYSLNDMGITITQIEALLGYKEDEERAMAQELINEEFIEASDLFNIRAEYRIYRDIRLNSTDKSLDINNIHFNIQKIVFNQLKKSESIAVFLCTAGEDIGKRSRELMKEGDPLKGYILDVIGSLAVDAAADLMQDELAFSAGQYGYKISNRYSPGYCGWSVGEQHKLFQLMPENYCGIRLTESALMDPVKSASGIIGIGENVKYNKYTCSYCDMKNCTYRDLRDEKEEMRKGSMA